MPAAGTGAHVPTSAQLTQLAALQATQATAVASLKTAQTNYNTAQAAAINTALALKNFEQISYGGLSPISSTVLDAGPGTTGIGVPNATEISQLKTLTAALATANATLTSNLATLNSAAAAKLQSDKAVAEYMHYIYGGGRKANTLDEGSQDAT